jgi:TetR/AcrR family transcriptional repressor of lmrAB and yxaGH operons
VTLDAGSGNEPLRLACARAFGLWLEIIAAHLRAVGAPEADADDLAGFLLSAIEGAIILARAAKSPRPLVQTARLVRAAIDREAQGWRRKPPASG